MHVGCSFRICTEEEDQGPGKGREGAADTDWPAGDSNLVITETTPAGPDIVHSSQDCPNPIGSLHDGSVISFSYSFIMAASTEAFMVLLKLLE